MNFEYKVMDSYREGGQKVPELFAQNAVFVDCSYLHKDVYKMVYELSMILME